MTNSARIQDRIYYGYGKGAARLGTTYTIYRSPNAINPIQDANIIGTLLLSANVSWTYSQANKYGNAVWQLLVDGRELQPFDYLMGKQTFFVAGMQSLLPILGVDCNRTLTIKRPTQPTGTGKGIVGYSGYDPATATTLMENCPASVLSDSRGETNPNKLPLDTKVPRLKVLLPALPGISLRIGDIILDDRGVHSAISGVELTELGWRLNIGSVEI